MSETATACRPFEEDLSALLDAELDVARSAELHAHLASCAACAHRAALLRSADGALRDAARATPAIESARVERLREATAARVVGEAFAHAEPKAGSVRAGAPRRHRSVALAVAAAIAAGVGALLLFAERPETTRQPVAVAQRAGAQPLHAASDAIAAAEQRIAAQTPSGAFAASGASAPPDAGNLGAPASLENASDEELELAVALVELERGASTTAEPVGPIRERIAQVTAEERNVLLAQIPRLRAMSAEERTALRERWRRAREHPAE